VHQLKALVEATHELTLLNFWRCLLFCQSIVFLSNFMKPTTIYLPEETENQVQEIANNTGKSVSVFIYSRSRFRLSETLMQQGSIFCLLPSAKDS